MGRRNVLLVLAVLLSGCGADLGTGIEVDLSIKYSMSLATWSPDGSHIAYVYYHAPSTHGIWVVDTTGAGAHPILSGSWFAPDWAPDGVHLAVCKNPGIYSVRSNGDSLRQITTQGFAPHWSPDGTNIVYYTRDTLGIGTIWLVHRDGTGVRSLAPPPDQSWTDPDWSPDGAHLIHLRILTPGGTPQVFVMDTTGHGEQQLTTDTAWKLSAEWSPDGQWITYGTSTMVWIMKSDGTEAHELVGGDDPSWSPDSRRIVYSLIIIPGGILSAIDIVTMRQSRILQASGGSPDGTTSRRVVRAAPVRGHGSPALQYGRRP